jgi:hypothetical protein
MTSKTPILDAVIAAKSVEEAVEAALVASGCSQLTEDQLAQQKLADSAGREFVTEVDGRIAIILRPRKSHENTSDAMARIAELLGNI